MKYARFKMIWSLDFEFGKTSLGLPHPVCMVAKELHSGNVIKLWRGEFFISSPFGSTEESLFIAFFSSAEWACFIQLGWQLPKFVLDLFVEFRNLTNADTKPESSLLGALRHFGLPHIDGAKKDRMRELVQTQSTWLPREKMDILEYCESDVLGCENLFNVMKERIDLDRALIRGLYMTTVAVTESLGIPIDTELFDVFQANFKELQENFLAEVQGKFNFFENLNFRRARFEEWLETKNYQWPRLESGQLDLQDKTFKDMVDIIPELQVVRDARALLSSTRLNKFPVYSDGRNRFMLSPFASKTSRNQPKTSEFIFGAASWMRSFIKPGKGFSLAYIDWSQQEFGVAAALSGDPKMKEAYTSGDPYLTFAKQAGAAPTNATKDSHKEIRDLYKRCVLAVQYGMGEYSLAVRLQIPVPEAKKLLQDFWKTYKKFSEFCMGVKNHASMFSNLKTVFGWNMHYSNDLNYRSIQNFPMQANGAEMLRIACLLGFERSVKICATVHDAVLIEAPSDSITEGISLMQGCMCEASRIVLNGFELRSDAEIVHYPDRYTDKRGVETWKYVSQFLEGKKQPNILAGGDLGRRN